LALGRAAKVPSSRAASPPSGCTSIVVSLTSRITSAARFQNGSLPFTGSQLLQRALKAEMRAEVEVDKQPEGMKFTLRLPLAA
jgi:hypothetical protein